jgi:hypothetical protein
MLYQYRSKTSLYFGHRFTQGAKGKGHTEGYMAGRCFGLPRKILKFEFPGGGYVLSKKALRKLVEELIPLNKSTCIPYDGSDRQTAEDVNTGDIGTKS